MACTLDIIGDKWTMIIIRDLLMGAEKYNDFLSRDEKITTNILADRLKKLESEGLVNREQYQDNPPRYRYILTEKGRDLSPLMKDMVTWAFKYKEEVIRKK
ncbi:MAG: winged helix-turn-helix transcriptional regulator [Spirochaetota bacterium]